MRGIVLQDVAMTVAAEPLSPFLFHLLSLANQVRDIAHRHADHVEDQGNGEAQGRSPPETCRVPVPHRDNDHGFLSRPELVEELWRVPMSDEGVNGAAHQHHHGGIHSKEIQIPRRVAREIKAATLVIVTAEEAEDHEENHKELLGRSSF